jgi:hypothetical protein
VRDIEFLVVFVIKNSIKIPPPKKGFGREN